MVQKNWFILIAALAGGLVGAATVSSLSSNSNFIGSSPTPTRLVTSTGTLVGTPSFVEASANVLPTVVHIKNSRSETYVDPFYFDPFDFFGGGNGLRQQKRDASSTGSGVIISADGYIVTNNHVVQGAEKLEVTLDDKRVLEAQVIGTDPNTDLALIKVSANNLLACPWGNSDDVQVGEWALAVGNPFNLNSTVTAGIISAKGRDINILNGQSKIESFLQTDAAVNPGNSGGPLISTDGKMVGINSAIASPTGSFAGYSFTIPVNIVKKVIADVIKFGTVQRAFLGIQYPNEKLSEEDKKANGIKEGEGVYVMDVTKDGAAQAAGIKKGDIITKINGMAVTSGPEMVGQIATYRPGDKINITYKRDGKESTVNIMLRNSSGNTDMVKTSVIDKLGVELQTISKDMAKELGVNGGVEIRSISANGLFSRIRVQEGYVIIRANGKEVKNIEDLRKVLDDVGTGSVKLEGMYPGYDGVYPIVVNLTK